MTVAELIAELQKLPQDAVVNINDNDNGILHEEIGQVDYFVADDQDPECVVIQVNC